MVVFLQCLQAYKSGRAGGRAGPHMLTGREGGRNQRTVNITPGNHTGELETPKANKGSKATCRR